MIFWEKENKLIILSYIEESTWTITKSCFSILTRRNICNCSSSFRFSLKNSIQDPSSVQNLMYGWKWSPNYIQNKQGDTLSLQDPSSVQNLMYGWKWSPNYIQNTQWDRLSINAKKVTQPIMTFFPNRWLYVQSIPFQVGSDVNVRSSVAHW